MIPKQSRSCNIFKNKTIFMTVLPAKGDFLGIKWFRLNLPNLMNVCHWNLHNQENQVICQLLDNKSENNVI